MTYTRRTPLSAMKWTNATYTTLPVEWSEKMAYVVGLVATDGCLGSRRRTITFTSADRDLVALYLETLGRTNKIGEQRTKTGGLVYRAQFTDTRLYQWLTSVGITPRKSLTLGAIDVPNDCLAPLVRGLLDGDGSVTNGIWKADTSRRSDYYYEWFRTRFVSASRLHLEWLKAQLGTALGLRGWIWWNDRQGKGIGVLTYGKHDSIALLQNIYSDPTAPCLARKRAIWESYAARNMSLPQRTAI
jgi:LAGLIDADG DNA endonuclease family protein